MSYIDKYWIKYLKTIYTHGTEQNKDDSPIKQYYGYHITIPAPYIPPFKKTNLTEYFLTQVQKGEMNTTHYPIQDKALYEYIMAWEKPEMIESTKFIYTYPERLHNYNNIDQYETIKHRLITNLGSNRAVATLYNPNIDKERTDIPCLNWLQATVEDNKNLRLHCMFRSNDIYGAWPSNMMLLFHLGFKLTDDLNKYNNNNITFHSIDYHCSSAHYYKTDEPAVKKIISG